MTSASRSSARHLAAVVDESFGYSLENVSAKYQLTPREEEVLVYLVEGYSRPYIEKALYISKSTAKSHTYHIYQKLGINSQDELLDLVKQDISGRAT